MRGSGLTKIIDDVELKTATNYGLGVSTDDCESGCLDNIYSFYTPAYDWNNDQKYASLISQITVNMVSEKITQQLEGVHPEGKKIIVPDLTIRNMLSSKFKLFPSYDQPKIIDESVGMIVGFIRNDFQAIKTNQQYSIWTTILGENNEYGMTAMPPIKLNRKQKNKIFMWNY